MESFGHYGKNWKRTWYSSAEVAFNIFTRNRKNNTVIQIVPSPTLAFSQNVLAIRHTEWLQVVWPKTVLSGSDIIIYEYMNNFGSTQEYLLLHCWS